MLRGVDAFAAVDRLREKRREERRAKKQKGADGAAVAAPAEAPAEADDDVLDLTDEADIEFAEALGQLDELQMAFDNEPE
jgi:hypothetical protein